MTNSASPMLLLLAMGLAALAGACAPKMALDSAQPRQPVSIDRSKLTLAPLSYVRFCMDNAQECRTSGTPNAIITLTPETEAALERVNRQVNSRIRPSHDAELWRINPATGNCNDYVVSKRHELIRMGVPASALLIAVVKTRGGEGHLLLVARTDRGELVLDNLTSDIRRRQEVDYVWLKRQTPVDPDLWESL